MPGWTAYRAAVIGDGVCLPVLIAALTSAACETGATPKDRRATGWATIAGAAVGIGIQASWLLSPDTKLNWTIPRPHTFNAPGWYHAAFFVAVTTVVAALVTLATRRAWATASAFPNLTLIAASASTFAMLQGLDAGGPAGGVPDAGAARFGLLGLVVAVLTLLQLRALSAHGLMIFGQFAGGALGATAVAESALSWPRYGGWSFLLATTVMAAVAVEPLIRRAARSGRRDRHAG